MSVATIKADAGTVVLTIHGVRTRDERDRARVELALAAMRVGAEVIPEGCNDQIISRALARQQRGNNG